jgi:hypothetical protein
VGNRLGSRGLELPALGAPAPGGTSEAERFGGPPILSTVFTGGLRGAVWLRRRLVYEPFGPLNSLHTLGLLPAPIKATRLLKSVLG